MKMPLAAALLLTLAACSGPAPEAPQTAETQSFGGAGRDRLCIAKQGNAQRAGLIVYGAGDANCSASGTLTKAGAEWQLTPHGEGACRIGLATTGAVATVTSVPETCAYYCAPGAALAGKRFIKDAKTSKVTDLGGHPLC